MTRVRWLASFFALGALACDAETAREPEEPEIWVQVVGGTDVRTHAVFELTDGDSCERWSSVSVWQDDRQLADIPADEEGALPSPVEVDLRGIPRPPTSDYGEQPTVTFHAECESGGTVVETVALPASLVATQGWLLPRDYDARVLAVEDDGHRLLCAGALVRLDEHGAEMARVELVDSCTSQTMILRNDESIALRDFETVVTVLDRATLSPRWEGSAEHLGLDPELDGAVIVTVVESPYAASPSEPLQVERWRFDGDAGFEAPSWTVEVPTAVDDATFALEAVGGDDDRAWLLGIRTLPSTPPQRTLERWWVDASGDVDVELVMSLVPNPASSNGWVEATADGQLALTYEDGVLQVIDLSAGTVVAREDDIGRPRDWIVASDVWIATDRDLLRIDRSGEESVRKHFAGPIGGLRAADARVGVFVDFHNSLGSSLQHFDHELESVWSLRRSVQALTVGDDGRTYLMTEPSALFVL